MTINETKKIREEFNFTHIIIFGVSEDGTQHVSTHGKTIANSKEAADMGNNLKLSLGWPPNLANSKPLERICKNCSYFQLDFITNKCMFEPKPIDRDENDRACSNFDGI